MSSPLNYSRVSKADSEALRSTGVSLVFRTVGRNIKPSWSNRITKDVNDLSYNIDINFFGVFSIVYFGEFGKTAFYPY